MKIPLRIDERISKKIPKNYSFSTRALRFDGTNLRQVTIAADASHQGAGDWTWIFWVRNRGQAGLPGVPRIMARQAAVDSHIIIGAGLAVALNNLGYTDGLGAWRDTGALIPLNLWSQIIVMYDAAPTPTMYGYINLALVDTWNVAGAPFNLAGTITLGRRGPELLNGDLAENSFHMQLLTAAQREESFRQGIARVENDCRICLRMEEGAGLNTLDLSPFGNDGTLTPGATPPIWIDTPQYELLVESGQ